MLVYEKVVEGIRHLFGTLENVPAEGDSQLTYKDADGDAIEPVLDDSYVDDSKGGIIRQPDGKFVAAFIGDTCIVPGKDWEPSEKIIKELKITRKPVKTAYVEGEFLDLTGMKVQATYESGDKEQVTEYTTTPNAETALALSDTSVVVSYEGKSASFAITVSAAAE